MWRSVQSRVQDTVQQQLRRPRPAAMGNALRVTGLAALSLSAGTALAQNAGPPAPAAAASDTGALQEVVVTAQFRSENVQQAPLAISAVNAAMLEEKGQTSLTQLTSDVPSVQLAPNSTAFGPTMVAYIRGIGQGDVDPALEPGVGIYIDDVYFGTTLGSLLDLLDLDRVEVLRGPQGTLEGMNSEGGAIKLFSKVPDGKESTTFDALYGSREHVELRASTSFAITDNLFVRLSGVGNHQNGYENVLDFGCANPSFAATDINGVAGTYSVAPGLTTKTNSCQTGEEGGIGYVGGRASIRWVINDSLEATLIGDLTNQDQENPAGTLIHASPLGPLAINSITLPATNLNTGQTAQLPYNSALVPAMIPSNPYNTYTTLCLPALTPQQQQAGLFGPLPAVGAECGQNRTVLRSWGTQLNVSWQINDTLSLKNITAERAYSSQWYEDNDASPWPLGLGADGIEHHQFSEELRLNGSYSKLLDYTVGGYYFSEKSVYSSHQDLWYSVGPGALDFLQDDPIIAHDKAFYLHTVWHLAPKLDLTAAGRYTSQDKDYHYVRVAPETGPGANTNSAFLVAGLNGVVGHYAATRFDYRGDLAYHFTDDLLGYAQISTGFKGGGVNPRPFYQPQAISFAPETLTTYELGMKSTWLDRRLKVNLDGFFSRYDNIQLGLLNCGFIPSIAAASQAAGMNLGSPCALPYNVGDAHEDGVELETELRLGGFRADLDASYIHFNYTALKTETCESLGMAPTGGNDQCSVSGVQMGMVTPFLPKISGSLGAQYTWLLPKGSVTVRGDANARSEIYNNAVNGPLNRIGGYTVYNAHAFWDSANADWEVGLQVVNLTNKFYYLNVFDLSGAGGGSTVGVPVAPREFDIELKHKM